MRIYENGTYRDLTLEELAAMEAEAHKAAIIERARPLTEAEVSRMLIAEQINTLTVDDNTALRMREFYPTFKELCDKAYTAEKIGFKFSYNGSLFKTKQANYTFVSYYPPEAGTESLYEKINETHTGTYDDPIPYDGNMVLDYGKYYMQDYTVYKCIRDTLNPVYNALSELVGIYVETV